MKDFIDILTEAKTEKAKGSKEGRDKMLSSGKNGNGKTKSQKSRVKVYKSITDALKKGYIGQMFSTKDSGRLYVITRKKWGKDNEQIINGRSAKGFSPGSIPSSFKDVKGYAVRTMVRHTGSRSKKDRGAPYWSREKK